MHKEVCLKINGKQRVKLRNESIKSNNYFKQLVEPFKIYANFKSVLRGVQKMIRVVMLAILKNIKSIFLAVLLTKLCV